MKIEGAALAVLMCILASAVEGKLPFATQAECPQIDSTCPGQLQVNARAVEPVCPSDTELDRSLNLCFSPCSRLSSTFIKFSVYNKDPSSCLPSCPTGYSFTGVVGEKAQCAKCQEGATLGQSATGVWRCSQPGLPSSAPTMRSRSLRDRTHKTASCPEGSFSDPDGGCHACGVVATPASIAAGAPEAGPFYNYDETEDVEYYAIVFDSTISGRSAPICIPEACCVSSAGEYTGEGDEVAVDDIETTSEGDEPVVGNSQDVAETSEEAAVNDSSNGSQDVPESSTDAAEAEAPADQDSSTADDVPTEEVDNEAQLQVADDENDLASILTEGRR